RARHGLDRPLPERYLRWVASLARGELGYSFAYGSPVAPLLWPRARNTLLLTATATAVAWALAIPVGIWWATLRGRTGRHLLGGPFVPAARGHGLSETRVLLSHALPAAANPLISLFGLSLAGLLSMSLLVEVVMSWPGLGPLLLEAILARDFYLVLGLVLASTFLL